jgi:hypothetical protein
MLALAGCTFLSPQATLLPYNPSDGVSLNVGAVQLRNAFAISPKGTDANFVGVLINSSKSTQNVVIEYTEHVGSSTKDEHAGIRMPAGAVISFGEPGVPQLVFRNAGVKAGALLKIFVQYGSVSGKTIGIPVLNGSEKAYRKLLPLPTPKPTATVTPTPTPTP